MERLTKKISKELTPLEVSKLLKDFVFELELGNVDKLFVHGSFDIIETALKQLEGLEEELGAALDFYECQTVKEWVVCMKKKLEAFEIIKKKGLHYLEVSLIRSNISYEDYCVELSREIGFQKLIDTKLKTEEEYDLLKEVLL